MSLHLALRPHEQLFVNGAHIANGADSSTIIFSNFAHILRGKDIMAEAHENIPINLLYVAVQTMLLKPPSAEPSMAEYQAAYARALAACGTPDALTSLAEADHLMQLGNFYGALMKLRPHILRTSF